MKFRLSYNISNTTTEILIKFIKILLKECRNIDHKSFSNSLYMLRKSLGLIDRFMDFAICKNYHKLYKKEEIIAQDD